MAKTRCAWCGTDPLYVAYHDDEWGVPVHDDRQLFEMIVLDGAQAGLSWITILRKRARYREVFDHFDADKVAGYDEARLARLLQDPGIVRNRLKVKAAVTNARATLRIRKEQGSLAAYLWRFVGGKPIQNHWKSMKELPTRSPESDAMSRAMKKDGFSFCGTTICYAFMQAAGMVNDHTVDCFRYHAVQKMR